MTSCYNPFSLEGKKIFITGASSGIGKATAIECARLGATLIITGRNETRLAETLNSLEGDGHKMIIADLTKAEDIERLVNNTEPVDGLVLSSGISIMLPLKMAKRDKILSVFETNILAPAELIRSFLKKRLINNEASVVSLASVQGVAHWIQGNGIYGASKAAISSWIRTLAVELSPKRIRANSICPGMTETPLIHNDGISDEELQKDTDNYLMHRYSTPQEIAWAVVYFLSDASKWVTGTNFIIDGGCSIKP